MPHHGRVRTVASSEFPHGNSCSRALPELDKAAREELQSENPTSPGLHPRLEFQPWRRLGQPTAACHPRQEPQRNRARATPFPIVRYSRCLVRRLTSHYPPPPDTGVSETIPAIPVQLATDPACSVCP